MRSRCPGLIAICLAVVVAATGAGEVAKPAADEKPYVPVAGQFPPPDAGAYFAGELVAVDHVNRRGALRIDGDNSEDRYHSAPPHRFALLPYGTIRYHGAPAELRDVPIGTHLHGYFVLPPEGDKAIPPATSQFVPKTNHALSLEDDLSFYQQRGQAWKVVSVELKYDASSPAFKKGEWKRTPVTGKLNVVSTGTTAKDGRSGAVMFEVDRSTRFWKGREAAELEDLAPDADWKLKDNVRTADLKSLAPERVVQLNLTWAADSEHRQFHCADVWLDQESLALAAEQQRRIHLRHQHHRWLAGWIDHVEHQDGGKGIVTVTLFGGMDPALYDDVRAQKKPGGGAAIAVGEKTLRTYWQNHDHKGGPVVGVTDVANPPPGSSGLQVRVQIGELLEGYRPGRIVRLRPNGWPNVKTPPEERVLGDRFKAVDDP